MDKVIAAIVAVVVVVIAATVGGNMRDDAIESAKTPAQKADTARRDKEINIVLAGARRLKDAMKKPETFELRRAMMIDGKVICYEYRSRNSFNDVVSETYVVSDTVSSSSYSAWAEHCAGKNGDDYTSVRAVL